MVVVIFSDAIVVVVIIVLGQVHDAVCVAARAGKPDSSQGAAATMADSTTSRSFTDRPIKLWKLEIAMHKRKLTHNLVRLPIPPF
jgi:hypothetical protein